MSHLIAVGQVFGQPPHPEGSEFNFHGTTGESGFALDLILRFDNPNKAEVAAVRSAPLDFALVPSGSTFLFLYRADPGIPWSDCPYTWHRLPADRRVPPPAEGGESSRAMISVILLDAKTGIVKALRAVTLSPEFTVKLFDLIRKQIATPFSEAAHEAEVQTAYGRWSQTDDMVPFAVARCRSGD